MTDANLTPPYLNPFEWFGAWFDDASKIPNLQDYNACALATVGATGQPSLRIVLLKEWDEEGFVFYTNLTSRKGMEALAQKKAAMTLHWPQLHRQVRIEGVIRQVPDSQADAYFATRSRGSQLGAWASLQSKELDARSTLIERVEHYTELYQGEDVPRPPHWSGLQIRPTLIEFWEDGEFRLHDRFAFSKPLPDDSTWEVKRLYP